MCGYKIYNCLIIRSPYQTKCVAPEMYNMVDALAMHAVLNIDELNCMYRHTGI